MLFLIFDTQFDSGKMNVGFDGLYSHDSHDKFNALGLARKSLIIPEDLLSADASMTTKRMELFDLKEFLAVALGAYD